MWDILQQRMKSQFQAAAQVVSANAASGGAPVAVAAPREPDSD